MPIRRGTHPRVTSLRPTLEYALADHGTTCVQLRADGRQSRNYLVANSVHTKSPMHSSRVGLVLISRLLAGKQLFTTSTFLVANPRRRVTRTKLCLLWVTERPFELHLENGVITGSADVILDNEDGSKGSMATLSLGQCIETPSHRSLLISTPRAKQANCRRNSRNGIGFIVAFGAVLRNGLWL
jgi:hypothetical protein